VKNSAGRGVGALLLSSVEYDKILCKSDQKQLVMVNYACGFNQSETGKYFECIIINNSRFSSVM